MTTKIQNIAMFAIAAFALSGMAITPAFAAQYASTDLILLEVGTTYADQSTTQCGDNGTCWADFMASEDGEWIQYKYGPDDATCDVTVEIVGGGLSYSKDHGTLNSVSEWLISVPQISTGDRLVYTATYTNCT